MQMMIAHAAIHEPSESYPTIFPDTPQAHGFYSWACLGKSGSVTWLCFIGADRLAFGQTAFMVQIGTLLPKYIFVVLSIILIIASLTVSYYCSSRKISERLDSQMQFLTKLSNKGKVKKTNDNSVDKQSVLKFLGNSERSILEELIERKEGVYQSEISRMEHMTKLKTHRAVKSLAQKGLVRLERHGTTNKIFLTQETQKLLSSLA